MPFYHFSNLFKGSIQDLFLFSNNILVKQKYVIYTVQIYEVCVTDKLTR